MSTFFWTVPPENIKNFTKHAALDLIRFTPGGVSRVELARQLGLTRAAVTSIINDFITIELVRECGEKHTGGRKPVVLEINPKKGYVVGIDMGATHAEIILADLSARTIKDAEVTLDIKQRPAICLDIVHSKLLEVLDSINFQLTDIQVIGVGVPGPIVRDAGLVSAPPIMPGWDGFPIRDTLQERWGCPVTLNNDADLGALGEWAYGAGRGERNLVYIKVGTGIGAGILLDGQIYHGTTGSAGEIGHITIDEKGPLCTCGNRGCLEAIAGGNAIATKAKNAVRKGQRTELASIQPLEKITTQDVIAAARRGDLVSQQLFTEAGVHLGTAIAGLVNLFNPSMVIVGGSVSQIGDLLLEPIRRTVHQRSLVVASQAVRISASLLGRRSSGIGAVVQANSKALHHLVEKGS